MTSVQTVSRWRKGTVSCTECRRRKVRCVRLSEASAACRQCEERGVACIAQTSSQKPLKAPQWSSRNRIAQLEVHVAMLTSAIHGIESKLGIRPSEISSTVEDLDSGGESDASEVLVAEQGSHLRSLFQNEWLSVQANLDQERLLERQGKSLTHLLDTARPKLQKLIPSKEEVSDIARCTFDWLAILHAMLPQPFIIRSQSEVVELYSEMCKPDVDVFSLGSWLLTVAITAQQIPQGPMDHEDRLARYKSRVQISQSITSTVESAILSHDRLLGTAQGLGMAIHYIRLQIGEGSFQKAWIRLRHVIAIAELMGLPRAHQAVQPNNIRDTGDHMPSYKADLWELMCNVDRLLGMIVNLAPVTRRRERTDANTLVLGDAVQLQMYLRRLMDIAARVHDLDGPEHVQLSGSRLHWELAEDLGALAAQTPDSWWTRTQRGEIGPGDVVQFLHYCVAMRIHLPLALRQDAGQEHIYSQLACTDACSSLAERYEPLSRSLPPGFFVSRLLDLYAFIAAVVLLLSSRSTSTEGQNNFRVDKSRLHDIAMKIIQLMDERSKAKVGPDFAREGSSALSALYAFLQHDGSGSGTHMQDLTVKVPLLGKIHLRRNLPVSGTSAPGFKCTPIQRPVGTNIDTSTQNQAPLLPLNDEHCTRVSVTDNTSMSGQWLSNDLSWSIEGSYSSLFEDIRIAEGRDRSTPWQDMLSSSLSYG